MKATGKLFIIGAMALLMAGCCDNCTKDYSSEPLDVVTKAAEAGDAAAQYELGYRHGVNQNYKAAVKWYTLSADQGNAEAQCNLGVCYYFGTGVDINYDEAFRLFSSAAEQGNAEAQYNLGCCYAEGNGVEQDREEAAKWWTKAAKQGDTDAQYQLGICYYNGRGVTHDDDEAAKWFSRAAEQGHAEAQYELGKCYDYGKGVKQDNVEAVKWWTKAAEQGVAEAQYLLGIQYEHGWGVAHDDKEAAKWYAKAAEQGHAGAKRALNIKEPFKKNGYYGTINDHEYVDLGLSVKWATCNVSADSLAGKGDCYAWGEITPKEEYTYENYTKNSLNKDITGNPNYDAATAKWGNPWRMPTKDEMIELMENSTTKWTIRNGVEGMLVTSNKNGNSIFFPNTRYWSSSLCNESCAYYLDLYKNLRWYWDSRSEGLNIRPVADKNRNDKICDAYMEKLKGYEYVDDRFSPENVYALYDITNNGIPELWVEAGTCNADYTIFVYTYENNGLREIGQFHSGDSGFYFNNKGHYVAQIYSHGSYFIGTKHIYDGRKIKSTIFFEAGGYGEVEAAKKKYKKEIEAARYDEADELEWFDYSEAEPILRMFD